MTATVRGVSEFSDLLEKKNNIRVFRSFHKSDKSDISANVVDICLYVNIMLS